MKSTYCGVKANKEQNEMINFEKTEDGMIHIYLGSSDVAFTVKETKEIIEKLKYLTKNKWKF